MNDDLDFTITFHAPLLRATGGAADGFDSSVDLSRPLSAQAIKGVMLATARDVIKLPHSLVGDIFGTRSAPSPWHWQLTANRQRRSGVHHRITIDGETHTAVEDHLLRARTAHMEDCTFRVLWTGAPGSVPEDHHLVLSASACGVHALGAMRRRGLGWVGVSGGSPIDIQRLLDLRAQEQHVN